MADEDESACSLSGRKRKSVRARAPAAMEPPEYVGDTKTCPKCGSTEHCVFKYLNNGKPDQPRYRCLRCNHMHTHYPPGTEPPRPQGKTYTKHTLANPPEHCDLFDLRCPNDACETENPKPRFLYYNNNKPLQPRYRCLVCNVPWQPKLKSQLPAPPDDLVVPTQADFDHNVDSCYATEGAAPLDHMQEFVPPQQTLYYNPETSDSANLGPGDPNYLGMMQAQLQPYDNVGSCPELYPNGDPNYMDVMQGSQLQQPHNYLGDHEVNSLDSRTECYPIGDPNYVNVMQAQLQQQYYPTADPVPSMGSCTDYGNISYSMQGRQPCTATSQEYVDLGGADANVNYTMQGDQQPYSEISQDQYYVNSLGCTHHDPSMSYINVLQSGGPDGHTSMQTGDQEQLYHPEECFARSDTFHVDAGAIEAGEEYLVYPGLDPALSSGIYALDAPEVKDQWLAELLAVDG